MSKVHFPSEVKAKWHVQIAKADIEYSFQSVTLSIITNIEGKKRI